MRDIEMITFLNDMNIGEKIIVGIKSFDNSIVEMQGTYEGELEQYGYYSLNGSWSLYSIKKYIPDIEESPCYKFLFKQNRKRKTNILKIGFEVGEIKRS